MKRVASIVFAVLVLAGLVLFSGPLVRGLTLSVLMIGLMWWGLVGPYFKRTERHESGERLVPRRRA